jgi:hypothetical protein
MTLEEARNVEYRQIVAACSGASSRASARGIAEALYQAVLESGGKEITEADVVDGLLDIRPRY